MAIDFHFVPFPPEAISGPEVLEQIEIAINELGGTSDDVRAIAEEALERANEALSEAGSAVSTANEAQATANRADQKAQEAIDIANDLDVRVTNAQNRADGAYDIATQADSNSTQAIDTANNAIEIANEAIDNADTAQQTAEEANQKAEIALGYVEYLGVYIENAGSDLNLDIITSSAKYFVTSENSTNYPHELSVPYYLDVENNILDDGTKTEAIQYAFNSSDLSKKYGRSSTIDNTDPDNPIVTWSGWALISSDSSSENTETKNYVLGAVTITNPATDIKQAVGYNGRVFTTVDFADLPESGPFALEFVSANDGSGTVCQAVSINTKNLYYANTTSNPDIATGTSFYRITATTGTTSVEDTLVFSSTANGLTLRPQTGGAFTVSESTPSGAIALIGKIDFYSDNTEFRENGFTLTIQEEIGGSPQPGGISVDFPALGAGDATVSDGNVTGSNSYLRYQSGEQVNAGGSEAIFYITATWTNYTGDIEWSDWVQPGATNYSATPQMTGQTWIDGSPVYQATVDCGALPNATAKNVPHGLTIARLIKVEGIAQTSAADSFLVLPHAGALADGGFNVQVDVDATNIVIQTSSDESSYAETHVTLTYTQA